jgi:hypothetical protein
VARACCRRVGRACDSRAARVCAVPLLSARERVDAARGESDSATQQLPPRHRSTHPSDTSYGWWVPSARVCSAGRHGGTHRLHWVGRLHPRCWRVLTLLWGGGRGQCGVHGRVSCVHRVCAGGCIRLPPKYLSGDDDSCMCHHPHREAHVATACSRWLGRSHAQDPYRGCVCAT